VSTSDTAIHKLGQQRVSTDSGEVHIQGLCIGASSEAAHFSHCLITIAVARWAALLSSSGGLNVTRLGKLCIKRAMIWSTGTRRFQNATKTSCSSVELILDARVCQLGAWMDRWHGAYLEELETLSE